MAKQKRKKRSGTVIPEIDPEVIVGAASICTALIQLWKMWRSVRGQSVIDIAQRKIREVSVDGDGHWEPQTPSANRKKKGIVMLGISKIKRGINHIRTATIKRINRETQYLLETTSEQRKKGRKLARAEKSAERLRRIRDFRPFNWWLLRKWQERNEGKLKEVCQQVEAS